MTPLILGYFLAHDDFRVSDALHSTMVIDGRRCASDGVWLAVAPSCADPYPDPDTPGKTPEGVRPVAAAIVDAVASTPVLGLTDRAALLAAIAAARAAIPLGPCPSCAGSRHLRSEECLACSGAGACSHCGVDCTVCDGFGYARTSWLATAPGTVPCEACDATGAVTAPGSTRFMLVRLHGRTFDCDRVEPLLAAGADIGRLIVIPSKSSRAASMATFRCGHLAVGLMEHLGMTGVVLAATWPSPAEAIEGPRTLPAHFADPGDDHGHRVGG